MSENLHSKIKRAQFAPVCIFCTNIEFIYAKMRDKLRFLHYQAINLPEIQPNLYAMSGGVSLCANLLRILSTLPR